MSSRKIVLASTVGLALVLTPLAAAAQTQGPAAPGQAPIALMLRAQSELGLTGEQVVRLQQIQQRLQEQNRPLVEQIRSSDWAQRRLPDPTRREQMRERIRQLTPEQRAQMRERMQNAMPEERQRMRREMMERMRPGPDSVQRRAMQERMQQLTPEQRERMQQMRERMRNATPEQRQRMRAQMRRMRGAPEIPAELQPVLQQLRENNRAASAEAREVLTPEQRDRLQQLMRERPGLRAFGPRVLRGARTR